MLRTPALPSSRGQRWLLAAVLLVTGCATRGTAVRELAGQELGCPSSSVRVTREGGHFYRATGCGESIRVACYDPYESTGAHKGWADGATAGNRVRCEKILEPSASAPPPRPTPTPSGAALPAGGTVFDRELAAKLLRASVERARSCGDAAGAGGPTGPGRARITFAPDGSASAIDIEPPFRGTEIGRCVERELSRVSLPPFSGGPVTVAKSFEIPRGGAPAAAGSTSL